MIVLSSSGLQKEDTEQIFFLSELEKVRVFLFSGKSPHQSIRYDQKRYEKEFFSKICYLKTILADVY